VGDASLKTEADIEEANTKKTMNTVRVTLRKAGTVSSLIKLVQKAQAVGFGVVVATDGRDHSDALDTFAAHAAVGLRAGQVRVEGGGVMGG
jgi:enolase